MVWGSVELGKITMQIFSGSSNQNLAKNIAGILGVKVGNIGRSKFENGEWKIRVETEKKDPESEGRAVIIQSLSAPVDEHLIEFCLICDALTRKGYLNLVGVVPWLGYSKQDKVFLPGEPLSAKVIAQIIQTTKIKKLITFDLHNRAITGFFDIPVVELSAKPVFLEHFHKVTGKNTVVVAPDEGAVKASAYFARELGVPIAYIDKRRDLKTGKVNVVGMSGDVKDKRVIIVDDMIVTGSTIMETAKYLKAQGAQTVSVAATHHLYVPGVQAKLEASAIDEISVTDTVYGGSAKPGKLKVLSVAPLIIDELS